LVCLPVCTDYVCQRLHAFGVPRRLLSRNKIRHYASPQPWQAHIGHHGQVEYRWNLFSQPLYSRILGTDIPALYPSIDLFLAPFLANETLYEDLGPDYDDSIFFSSFAVLLEIGMGLAGLLFLLVAATFKLANFGTYLPYSVLCGFFSAVRVLLWALAFSVDTSGKAWKMVFDIGFVDPSYSQSIYRYFDESVRKIHVLYSY
jgi:hypothetical protein